MTENSSAETEQRPEWLPSEPYTFIQIANQLADVVASKPEDYVYISTAQLHANSGCLYWHSVQEEPGCLIGQLMHRLGVPREVLMACDSDNQVGSSIIKQADFKLKGLFAPDAVAILQHIQSQQDDYKTWRQALDFGHSFRAGYLAAQSQARAAQKLERL